MDRHASLAMTDICMIAMTDISVLAMTNALSLRAKRGSPCVAAQRLPFNNTPPDLNHHEQNCCLRSASDVR
jgi:hypothetical protein